MSLNREYAKFLIAASNIYATESDTGFRKAESVFERSLLRLFNKAESMGIQLQDIAVITSITLAVVLTRADSFCPADLEFDKNVVSLRSFIPPSDGAKRVK